MSNSVLIINQIGQEVPINLATAKEGISIEVEQPVPGMYHLRSVSKLQSFTPVSLIH
ncbi:MAG: hypothetical protein ACI8SE_002255 [Bacteroidia bacterium]|jgi:hypothetical protein